MRPRLLALLLCALPSAALAGNAVDFEVHNKVLAGGKDRPSVTVVCNEDADRLTLELVRDDGKRSTFKAGRMRPGESKRFNFDVPPGKVHHFKATITVKQGPSESSANLEFAAEIVVPAVLTADPAKFDGAKRTMELKSTRPTSKVVIQAFGDQGEDLGTTEVKFDKVPANTSLPVTWSQGPKGRLMRLAVQVHDPDGFYFGLELFPWRVEIPHEEVSFRTGSAEIDPTEAPKLDASFAEVKQAVARYGRFAPIKLFIAGHTDTVGKAADNRTLSLNRARSISAYFRTRGLAIPVLYEGFGEDALKVATADETDEPQNRRAEYIVAIEPPAIPAGLGSGGWKTLR